MSKVALSGNASGTGTFTIASPNSNTDRTLNLPDASGTILTTATPGVPVNGPAFSASMSASQSISAATITKIVFNTETFDTNANYDPTTNYRFQPTVAGYYQMNLNIWLRSNGGAGIAHYSYIMKNGSTTVGFMDNDAPASGFDTATPVTALVYLNGSTDYLEAFARVSGGTGTVCSNNPTLATFSGSLVRAA